MSAKSEKLKAYPWEKFWETLVDDCLDNAPIYISKPDTHVCADHEQQSQKVNVLSLFAVPIGDNIFNENLNTLEKVLINISTSLSTSLNS